MDDHHTVEDVGICLGQAFAQALGGDAGGGRFGQSLLPMDETLILGREPLGRGCSAGTWPAHGQGGHLWDTELAKIFWLAFTRKK